MVTEQTARRCSLEAIAGRMEACRGEHCPFWEPGGAVLGGRCAVEELGVAVDAPLAEWLLEIRERLETAGSVEGERAVRGVFHQLLDDSAE